MRPNMRLGIRADAAWSGTTNANSLCLRLAPPYAKANSLAQFTDAHNAAQTHDMRWLILS